MHATGRGGNHFKDIVMACEAQSSSIANSKKAIVSLTAKSNPNVHCLGQNGIDQRKRNLQILLRRKTQTKFFPMIKNVPVCSQTSGLRGHKEIAGNISQGQRSSMLLNPKQILVRRGVKPSPQLPIAAMNGSQKRRRDRTLKQEQKCYQNERQKEKRSGKREKVPASQEEHWQVLGPTWLKLKTRRE